MGNMYSDSIFQWNVAKGCNFQCTYCVPSFQRQAKRQKHNCIKCYNYEPHFHPERLKINFNLDKYETIGDEFIWACSSGDIACMKDDWIQTILNKIKEYPNRTFFMQTKDPSIFYKFDFPENMLLGITMETNEYQYAYIPTKAPSPWHRYVGFHDLEFPRKVVTIEPIIEFRHEIFLSWLKALNPERIYIGYNSKSKSIQLPEPSLKKTQELIKELKKFTKVKTKYMKGDN